MQFRDFNLLDLGHGIQLTGAIYSQEGKDYLLYLPGENVYQSKEAVFMTMEDWVALVQQTDNLDVEILVKEENGKIGKAIVRKGQRQVEATVSWKVFKRDGYKCRYCGRDDVPLTVDHLVLWEEGGPSIEENLVTACRKCNRTRGNKQYADWLNDPYYIRTSRNLTAFVKDDNKALVEKLAAIPIRLKPRSR